MGKFQNSFDFLAPAFVIFNNGELIHRAEHESLAIKKRNRDWIEALAMWISRRIEVMRQVNKIRNEEVFKRIKESGPYMRVIKSRQ